MFLISALLASSLAAQIPSDIEALGRPYTAKVADATATLTYWPTETGTDLLFKAARTGKLPPANDLLYQLLDKLVTQVLKDHPSESKFGVALGPLQQSFIPPLQHYLVHSKAWDPLHGRPRDSRPLSALLTQAMNESGALDPVVKLFAKHGFRFSLVSLSQIEIEPVTAQHGARLPSYIWQMNFVAVANRK